MKEREKILKKQEIKAGIFAKYGLYRRGVRVGEGGGEEGGGGVDQ